MRIYQYLVAALLAVSSPAFSETGQIHVSGAGGVSVIPDEVTISWLVSVESPQAGTAYRQMAQGAADLLGELKGIGVEAADIQTQDLRISQLRDHDRNSVTGYEAATRLSIRLSDLTLLDPVINLSSITGMGGVQGISFDVADKSSHLTTARELAVQDALTKAKTYAKAAGVSLGSIISISESGTGRLAPMMELPMIRGASPVSMGSQTVSASVSLTFEIAE